MLASVPKQIYHWFRSAGMKHDFTADEKRKYGQSLLYFRKHGRRWRINGTGFLHGMPTALILEMSCEEEDFDRWANSVELRVPLPKTCKEFVQLVDDVTREFI